MHSSSLLHFPSTQMSSSAKSCFRSSSLFTSRTGAALVVFLFFLCLGVNETNMAWP